MRQPSSSKMDLVKAQGEHAEVHPGGGMMCQRVQSNISSPWKCRAPR